MSPWKTPTPGRRRIAAGLLALLLALPPSCGLAAGITDAVVRVFAGDGAGCGTLVHNDGGRGWILTAAHVVDDGRQLRAVWADGHAAPATVAAIDHDLDVALLSVAAPAGATTIPLAGSDHWPQRGDTVDLIGYGGGRLRHWQATVNGYALTEGVGKYQTLSLATRTIGGDSGGAIVFGRRLVGVIWGGPLAGPRGPMVATHGTCCVAIHAFLQKNRIRFERPGNAQIALPTAPACHGPKCPPPRYRAAPAPAAEVQKLRQRIADLEARLKQLERHPLLHADVDDVADHLIDRMAADPRFRGPPGKDGRDGKDGRAAENVDIDRLVDQLKQRLAGSIRIRVEPVRR